MPFLAPVRQHGRRDPDAVVANLDAQLAFAIGDCDIDRVSTRMARDVEQRFARDPPDFRRNKGMDLPWPSLGDNPDRYGAVEARGVGEFLQVGQGIA